MSSAVIHSIRYMKPGESASCAKAEISVLINRDTNAHTKLITKILSCLQEKQGWEIEQTEGMANQ